MTLTIYSYNHEDDIGQIMGALTGVWTEIDNRHNHPISTAHRRFTRHAGTTS
jgi:hypothetical protein